MIPMPRPGWAFLFSQCLFKGQCVRGISTGFGKLLKLELFRETLCSFEKSGLFLETIE